METKDLYFYDEYVVKNGELRKYYGDDERKGNYTFPSVAPIITGEAAAHLATNITFPEGIKVLGANLCDNGILKSVLLPDSLEEIGDSCFRNSHFANIDLPPKLKKIGEYAFSSTDLTELIIPPSVVELGAAILSGSKAKKLIVSPNAKIPNFLIAQSRITELRITASQFDEVIEESKHQADPDMYCPFGNCTTLKTLWIDDTEYDALSFLKYALEKCDERTFNHLFWNTPFHTDTSKRRRRA